MSHEKNNCQVTIFGAPYTLASSEPDEFVRQSAALVDVFMNEVAQQNTVGRDIRQIMVLAALRLASRVILLEKTIEHAKNTEQAILKNIELADLETKDL